MSTPNILFILADDMGAWALGCAGNSEIKTPNLDRLAARGVRLENAFCVSPVCSPARASLITGRIPSAHGVHDWISRGSTVSKSSNDDSVLITYMEGQSTYTDILAQNGYEVALSGKWHLGNSPQPQQGHGFWYVHAGGGSAYYNAPVIENSEESTADQYITHAFTNKALDFLGQQKDSTTPFYLGVHYTAPHSPWEREQHPPEYFDPYFNECPFESTPNEPMHPWQINSAPWGGRDPEFRREQLSGYYGSITAMDADIGRLLEELERQGKLDNTIVVFTSDNGMNMGHHGIYGKGNGTYPQNMYDSSVKVPFIIAGPGIAGGHVSETLFSHYDFLPSLLAFVGLESKIPAGLPGQPLTEIWTGKPLERDEPLVVFDEYGPVRMIRNQRYKYVHRFEDFPCEFYDLESDPGETNNCIDDPTYAVQVAALRGGLEDWFARYVIPEMDGAHLSVKGKGQLDRLDGPLGEKFAQNWHYTKDQMAL
ncbi:sulfatase-like hydrolase/transferase [Cerasicoccus arenae]|uniref:Arylsulfatase A family protein n=1 Tax=Cerasicoccus arenae TaxID=424488 RepID=A0A8J3GDG0_9BACT|nr:sulfatase-like hydrolase/transferase [Cerasicoccus arenae]MBK1857508.1 sulfatase-like hydrolase/transferase [Cerasicoccus arenae]GHB95425.1 arylsulfatase A family protein [Cerasicoccus arenae]